MLGLCVDWARACSHTVNVRCTMCINCHRKEKKNSRLSNGHLKHTTHVSPLHSLDYLIFEKGIDEMDGWNGMEWSKNCHYYFIIIFWWSAWVLATLYETHFSRVTSTTFVALATKFINCFHSVATDNHCYYRT